jgi:ketosteroid isomerase-like protein
MSARSSMRSPPMWTGAPTTGKTAQMNLHHYFKFRDGQVAYYRGTEDTAQTAAVLLPG